MTDCIVVVDEQSKPLGTVSDFDVRKLLLSGAPLDQPLGSLLNQKFKSDQIGTPSWKGFEEDPHQTEELVILLDNSHRVIGLRSKQKTSARPDNLVVLMVGGAGTRLRPLTNHCPKPLLPIKGKPLLERTIERLSALGFHRFCMAVGYKADMIVNHFQDGSRWNVDITYIHEKERLGTCGALRLLPEAPKLPLLVMNGDLVTDVKFDNLMRFHKRAGSSATVCVHGHDVTIPYGVITSDGIDMMSLEEKPTKRHWISAGIYVLSPETINMIPEGKPHDMPELLHSLSRQPKQVTVYPIRENWIDVGSLEEYERANAEPNPASDTDEMFSGKQYFQPIPILPTT